MEMNTRNRRPPYFKDGEEIERALDSPMNTRIALKASEEIERGLDSPSSRAIDNIKHMLKQGSYILDDAADGRAKLERAAYECLITAAAHCETAIDLITHPGVTPPRHMAREVIDMYALKVSVSDMHSGACNAKLALAREVSDVHARACNPECANLECSVHFLQKAMKALQDPRTGKPFKAFQRCHEELEMAIVQLNRKVPYPDYFKPYGNYKSEKDAAHWERYQDAEVDWIVDGIGPRGRRSLSSDITKGPFYTLFIAMLLHRLNVWHRPGMSVKDEIQWAREKKLTSPDTWPV